MFGQAKPTIYNKTSSLLQYTYKLITAEENMTTNNNNLKTTNNNFKAANNNFKKLVAEYKSEVSERIQKYDALKDLDLFILDNSIRESTVG